MDLVCIACRLFFKLHRKPISPSARINRTLQTFHSITEESFFFPNVKSRDAGNCPAARHVSHEIYTERVLALKWRHAEGARGGIAMTQSAIKSHPGTAFASKEDGRDPRRNSFLRSCMLRLWGE